MVNSNPSGTHRVPRIKSSTPARTLALIVPKKFQDIPARVFFAQTPIGKSSKDKERYARALNLLDRFSFGKLPMRDFVAVPIKEISRQRGFGKVAYNLLREFAAQNNVHLSPWRGSKLKAKAGVYF